MYCSVYFGTRETWWLADELLSVSWYCWHKKEDFLNIHTHIPGRECGCQSAVTHPLQILKYNNDGSFIMVFTHPFDFFCTSHQPNYYMVSLYCYFSEHNPKKQIPHVWNARPIHLHPRDDFLPTPFPPNEKHKKWSAAICRKLQNFTSKQESFISNVANHNECVLQMACGERLVLAVHEARHGRHLLRPAGG